MRRPLCACLAAGALAAAGCVSPEAARTRGGGPGGDTGNRPEVVKMHEGSYPYWATPVEIDVEPPPLDPAEHARRQSLP